ncbi:histone-lysine N-methyltransferase 2B-like, partial [Melanerpes formicivorus]|uniref:histone-lysine N-methyltransferase 2B-like n=1 Tax=Melanerpes formicivorus TaxID=211600 RepID=UPI00358FA4B9
GLELAAEDPQEPEGTPRDSQPLPPRPLSALALGRARATAPESIPRSSEQQQLEASADWPGGVRPRRGQLLGVSPCPAPALAPPPAAGAPPRKNRQARCGRCQGCRRPQDCATCANCRDKPKFGGPNTKKQCCVYRRCDKIEARKLERLARKGRCPPRESSEGSGGEEPITGWAEPPGAGGRSRLRPRPRTAAGGGRRVSGSPHPPRGPERPPGAWGLRGDSGRGVTPGRGGAAQAPPGTAAASAPAEGTEEAAQGLGPPRPPGPPPERVGREGSLPPPGWGPQAPGGLQGGLRPGERLAAGGAQHRQLRARPCPPGLPALRQQGAAAAGAVPGLLPALPLLLPGGRGGPGARRG